MSVKGTQLNAPNIHNKPSIHNITTINVFLSLCVFIILTTTAFSQIAFIYILKMYEFQQSIFSSACS